jgi:hypothetical protein
MGDRELELLFLISFLASFGFIRTSAHLIRAQVRWWPGNVEVGGTHIHHLVWGILLVLVSGYVAGVVRPDAPISHIAVVLFGIGTGLTMDEFALWLNLKDVYWEKEGRRSIDAVIVVGILAGLAVTGFSIWIEAAEEVEGALPASLGAYGALGFAAALVNAAKEKFGMAALSLLVPVAGLIGAVRLGKPSSLWAHHLYGEGEKLQASRRRFD